MIFYQGHYKLIIGGYLAKINTINHIIYKHLTMKAIDEWLQIDEPSW